MICDVRCTSLKCAELLPNMQIIARLFGSSAQAHVSIHLLTVVDVFKT